MEGLSAGLHSEDCPGGLASTTPATHDQAGLELLLSITTRSGDCRNGKGRRMSDTYNRVSMFVASSHLYNH